NVFVTSGLKYVQTGKSIKVTAKNEGQQQVWISYILNYSGKDFATGEMVYDQDGLIIFSWLVLVGEDEINKYEGKKPNSAEPDKREKPDIAKFTISGVVKELGSFQCVEGAIVELIPKSSNQVCRTDKNGRFKYTFTSLHSGRKELFVRKPYGQGGVSSHPLESVEQDLWPIKKYMFELDTKKSGADMIITDIIWMQKIRYIDNRDEKNLSFKFQKE
ncbi:MAG: hypothetical protein J7L25_03645, partial [Deltaproteobacteria bacterium]|nr:hypothetical protein [Candidatus Tharpella aukensis]